MEKLIAIESDDWGSLRVRNYQELHSLIDEIPGVFDLDAKRYNQNDTLESVTDIENLKNILEKHKTDKNPNGALFNFIALTHNPDFQKIKEANFKSYYREGTQFTYERYERGDVIGAIKSGITRDLIHVEFHGTEHINFPLWMRDLQNKSSSAIKSFEIEFWGFVNSNHPFNIDYQSAYELDLKRDIELFQKSIEFGLLEFEKLWGYKPTYFVPPNGPFPISLYSNLKNLGIEYICEPKNQKVSLGNGKFKRRINWLGKSHKGLITLTRNAFFEPNSNDNYDWIARCLNQIENSFQSGRPALLSTHRVNYMGGLNPDNAKKGLAQLDELLSKIITKWPDIRFVKSTEILKEWRKTNRLNQMRSMFK